MGILQSQQQQPVQQPNSDMVDMDQARTQMAGAINRLKRIVIAGQTILYDEKTSAGFLKHLDPEHIPQSVALVAAMVIAALIDKSNDADEKARKPAGTTFPPNMVMPAGALIANDLLDYACELFEVEMTEEMAQQTLNAFATAMHKGASQGLPQQDPFQQQQQGAMQ